MKKHLPLILILASLLLIVSVAIIYAQTGNGYDLTWWTVDGGGGTVSGGGYTLMGTAGQPDAGPALVGDGYTLVGGFWSGVGEAPPTCPDAYEPNEDFADAKPIAPGVAIQAYICSATDNDWFKFNVAAGQQITVDLTNLPQDYDLALYDPSNTQVGESAGGGTADEYIEHTASSTGAYRVYVHGYGGNFDTANPYTLLVQLDGAPPAHKIYLPVVLKRR